MKVSEIKRALKTATINVYVGRAALETALNASLVVNVPAKYEGATHPDTLLSVKAQANDRMVPDRYAISREYDETERARPTPYTYINLYKVSGWYAAGIETEIRYRGGSPSHMCSPETAANFFKVVENVVETYNLRHKYPECEVSQILAACAQLGANVVVKEIEGVDSFEWNQARIRRDPKNPA